MVSGHVTYLFVKKIKHLLFIASINKFIISNVPVSSLKQVLFYFPIYPIYNYYYKYLLARTPLGAVDLF